VIEPTLEERVAEAVIARLTPYLNKGREEVGCFSIKQAATFVGCSESHIRRQVHRGPLPVANIGTQDGPDYRITRGDLEAWLERRKATPSPSPVRTKAADRSPLPYSPHRRMSKS
jgi:excisionase family DNA binding protein